MRIKDKFVYFSLCILLSYIFAGCNKLVQVPNPITSVTALQTFSTDASATSAMLGIYSYLSVSTSSPFSNGFTTFNAGLSADELTNESSGFEQRNYFLSNDLNALQNSFQVSYDFWQPAYYVIYESNSIIAGVQASTGMTVATRNELIGEAKFIRAFCYFYLTNLFGDLPLVLDVDFNQTVLLAKVPKVEIYHQIFSDLRDAQSLLPSDFSLSGGLRIRPNKWAATSLLARAYLYQQNWAGADSAANAVINSGQFSLLNSLSGVFLANSQESIFQLQTNSISFPWATQEGFTFISGDSNSSANYWLTPSLLSAFEPNDLRRREWVDSTDFFGVYYYYPFKYQSRIASSTTISENYTILRFAEQYLIRAEAEANLWQLGPAISDVDTIRARAGLSALPNNLSQSQVLAAIEQENRIEFFAEWGHRWLDIKRWGIAIQTLDTISYKKANIDSTQLLYPIPMSEIQTDPNLVQNKGY